MGWGVCQTRLLGFHFARKIRERLSRLRLPALRSIALMQRRTFVLSAGTTLVWTCRLRQFDRRLSRTYDQVGRTFRTSNHN